MASCIPARVTPHQCRAPWQGRDALPQVPAPQRKHPQVSNGGPSTRADRCVLPSLVVRCMGAWGLARTALPRPADLSASVPEYDSDLRVLIEAEVQVHAPGWVQGRQVYAPACVRGTGEIWVQRHGCKGGSPTISPLHPLHPLHTPPPLHPRPPALSCTCSHAWGGCRTGMQPWGMPKSRQQAATQGRQR